MHQRLTIIPVLCLLFCLSGLSPLLAADWVLKNGSFAVARDTFEQTLAARGFDVDAISEQQQQALLQELFIRESLLLQQDKVAPAAMAVFEERLREYRRNQLARLVLDSLAEEGMPDFSRRARELYEVRKTAQYQLPLRLRVRVLRQTLQRPVGQETVSNTVYIAGHKGAATAQLLDLKSLRARLQAGELDFKQAVMQYSDDPQRTLHAGDSFWFQRGQQADAIFEQANKLSSAQALSEVFVHDGVAYILQFIGRQEPVQQSFAEVEEDVLTELQTAYRAEQRKLLLAALRDRFQHDTEIHPDFR